MLDLVSPLVVFGIIAGALSLFAYVPYIIDTLAGRTQPQRASWLIWSVLGTVSFFGQVFEGADASLWFAGVQVGGTIVVLLLSIWTGAGRYLKKSDNLILTAAGAGLVAWYMTDTAVYALGISITISLLGGSATVAKAYADPGSETASTWVIAFTASICAILSVGKVDWILLAYPLYLFTLYGAILLAMLLGHARKSRARPIESAVSFDYDGYGALVSIRAPSGAFPSPMAVGRITSVTYAPDR